MWSGLIAVLIGCTFLATLIGQWAWRRRFRQRLETHACALCGNGFDDAIAEYLGPLTAAERARLDRFQQRFASRKIRCGDCGAINLCTRDGQPFKAWIEND
jgi:hypothetical protein